MKKKAVKKPAKTKKESLSFNYNRLAAELLRKREEDAVTQRQAAAAIGISQPQFYKMELGHEHVSVVLFLKACNWLNTAPNTFFNL